MGFRCHFYGNQSLRAHIVVLKHYYIQSQLNDFLPYKCVMLLLGHIVLSQYVKATNRGS